MKQVYAFIFLLAFSVFGLPAAASASEFSQIYITEINWAGSEKSNADEWIELFNPNGKSVDISGWVLTGSATAGDALSFSDETVIDAHSTLLIANYELGNEKTTLMVEPDFVTSSLSLPNTDLEILLTTPEGVVVDKAVFGSGTPEFGSSDPKTSAERLSDFSHWVTSGMNAHLSDENQYGNPGVFETTRTEIDKSEEEIPVICEKYLHNQQTDAVAEDTVEEEVDESPHIEEVVEIVDPVILEMDDEVHDPIETEEQEVEVSEPADVIDTQVVESKLETACTCEQVDHEDEEDDLAVFDSAEPTDVLINEFVSNPSEGGEWIELYNATQRNFDLTGWTIEDATGKPFTLDGTLEAGAFKLESEFTFALNNSGDTIVLRDATGTLIDAVTYGTDDVTAPGKGESTGRNGENWVVYEIPSPGILNPSIELDIYESSPDQPELSEQNESTAAESDLPEASAEEEEVHKIVTILGSDTSEEDTPITETDDEESDDGHISMQGIVTAEPGLFGSQVAFVDGIQVYMYTADWPELHVGDLVLVSGEKSIARGEPRIKLSSKDDIDVLGSPGIESNTMTIDEALNQDEGNLVRIIGDVESRDGSNLYLTENGSTIKVVAHNNTGISWGSLTSSRLEITGIIRHIDGEIRMYPRSEDDVIIIEVPPQSALAAMSDVTKSDNNTPWAGIGLLGLTSIALGYSFISHRKKITQ